MDEGKDIQNAVVVLLRGEPAHMAEHQAFVRKAELLPHAGPGHLVHCETLRVDAVEQNVRPVCLRAEHPVCRRPGAGEQMGGIGQYHVSVVVLDHLEGQPSLIPGVVAVGDAHRNAGLFCLPHHKATEFVHVGMHNGIAGALSQHPVQRMGVDEGALLGDEGDAVDHTAQRFDLAFVHTGKGAYKIELHRVPVDAAIQFMIRLS